MADLSVPGVNGQYDKLIEALMKAERIPREKEATSLEKLKGQLSYWQAINQFGVQVRDVARSFYSFNNPFNEYVAISSNENAFTATASRDAKEENATIFVKQLASADSFLSNELAKDLKIEEGNYIFRVGERKLELNWRGGNYKSFMQAINRRGRDFLSVSEVKVTPKTTSLLFTSNIVGEGNKLNFEGDALKWAESVGILKKGESSRELIEKAYIKVPPFSRDEIGLSLLANTKNADFLEIKFVLEKINSIATPNAMLADNETNATESSKDKKMLSSVTGKNNNEEVVGSVSYEGIILKNNPSDVKRMGEVTIGDDGDSKLTESDELKDASVKMDDDSLEDITEKKDDSTIPVVDRSSLLNEKSKKEANLAVFSMKSADGIMQRLENIQDVDSAQVIKFALDKGIKFNSLLLNNDNSFAINIESIKIITKSSEEEYIPSNPIATASDAIISYQGIEMKRDSNSISDIIPSLTLNLHSVTTNSETLSVKPNTELLKNSIIEFVGKYNRLIAEINILTNNKPEIVEELGYFTEDEKTEALKRLGTFYGDSTLSSLKNNLQTRMMAAYGAGDEFPIKLLSQLGISTNASSSSSVDSSRLRGYLEIDEKILEKALQDNIEGVKSFFGFDSDGDVIVDSGLAYSIYEYLNPYTQRGGIFFTRMTGVEDKIKAIEKKIVVYDKKLAQKEAELKRKYSAMEGTLRDLKKQSDVISNFNRNTEK